MTDQAQAEARLTGSANALPDGEAGFRELADSISQLVWTADRSGRRNWFNRRWYDYTGTTLEEMQGWGWQKVHHPDHVDRVVRHIRLNFDNGTPWEDTLPLRGRDGTYRWFLSRALPVRNHAGDIVRWFGTDTDVTELKAAEERLRAARRELTQVTRRTTLAAMTASIAHEINQPLASIVTNADAALMWLDRDEPDLDEVRMALTHIVESGHRTSDILAGIRAMFRKDGQERVRLDVNDLVRDVLALAQVELDTHHVAVHKDLLDALPGVVGQRVPLQQVLLNLIMNAVDAMSALTDRTPQLSVKTLVHESSDVLITVADCGVGIDPKDIRRIFHAFFTTKPQGMGMGLAICRSIVEAHGGRLWAVPGTPHGSVFHVRLPAGG